MLVLADQLIHRERIFEAKVRFYIVDIGIVLVTPQKCEGASFGHFLDQVWILLVVVLFFLGSCLNRQLILLVKRCCFFNNRNKEATCILVMGHDSPAIFKLLESLIVVEVGKHGVSD